MTYNVTVPNAATSPGVFPVQCNTNFSRLKTLISGDHQFNDTAASTDGKHRQVTLITKSSFVSSLPSGTGGMLYNLVQGSNNQLVYYNGSKTYLSGAVLACVNFNGIGSNPLTIRSQYNVSSVTQSGSVYTITFTRSMPDNNYIVQCTGFVSTSSESGNKTRSGQVSDETSYNAAISTTFVKVCFKNSSGNNRTVDAGFVTILSVT